MGPCRRPGGVQREEHPAGLHHGERGHDQIGRSLHEHGEHRLRPDSATHEHPRQTIRTRVQLAEGEFTVGTHHGDRVRLGRDARRERLGHGHARRGRRGVVPFRQDPFPPGRTEYVHSGQRGSGVLLQRHRQAFDARQQELARPGRVDRGGGLHLQLETGPVVVHGHDHRVVRVVPHQHRGHTVEAGPGMPVGGQIVPVVEQRGEQRARPGHPAGPLRRGERTVFVHHQVGELAAHVHEGLVHVPARQAYPHRKRVDEQPRRTAGSRTGVRASEKDGSEHDVVTTGQRAEYARPRQVEQRRRAHPEPPRQASEPIGQRGVHRRPDLRRAGAITVNVRKPVRGGGFGDVGEQLGEVAFVVLL